MSLPSGDWRERIDDVDAALVDGFQSDFPVRERPFEVVGEQLGISGQEALERVERLREERIFRRFGPVLNPPVVGSSTLAAVSAPPERFDEVAAVVNEYRQVNHNYARDHEWNMWFVVTAGSRDRRDEILADIETRTGCEVLVLPMLTDYYIDLEFPVVNGDRFARESIEGTDASATRISEDAAADLTALDRRLLLAIQEGFPLSETPYRDVAATIDADVDDVLAAIRKLRETGCIKRVGCVVNHLTTGFDNNCMVVWDVPDEQLDDRGERVGALPSVTLCYHRPRRPEQNWPYNLFTMIHGRDADAVDEQIDELATEFLPYDHDRLYSTATLKQTGAQYDDIVGE
ncbi:Lrp/AsnC family transcriptional regulator [Haloarcula nitratireducens]|uniref:siroheme decarboxylase n=1 Tax=Haloarcula nitratireducens TaxID=2487749 RepID=A0AAW4PCC3_9EURY|nr:Lrp/AsnC family transcriptional regulator [Halomicroarcula nitratireducens]MBX0294927.1 Lrp/AsnC family transcriptional regulator [Halomicroarcula nitratireducens]